MRTDGKTQTLPRVVTAGVIADQLHVPLHRVLHILRTRDFIRPVARAGIVRLYERSAVAMVRHELHAAEARRHARKTGADGDLFDQK
jgi:hypothetical protein